jgi:hypothetical protein
MTYWGLDYGGGKSYIIRILVGIILEQRDDFVKVVYSLSLQEEMVRMESVRRGKDNRLQQVYLLCGIRVGMPEKLCFSHWYSLT